MNSSALSAFEAAANASGAQLSLTIRILLLALLFVWAGAFIYAEIHHFRHDGIDVFDALRKCLRVLFILSIAIVLVYVT
jgi:hypothetical protein